MSTTQCAIFSYTKQKEDEQNFLIWFWQLLVRKYVNSQSLASLDCGCLAQIIRLFFNAMLTRFEGLLPKIIEINRRPESGQRLPVLFRELLERKLVDRRLNRPEYDFVLSVFEDFFDHDGIKDGPTNVQEALFKSKSC